MHWNKKLVKNYTSRTSPWSDVDRGKKKFRIRVLEDAEASQEIEEVFTATIVPEEDHDQ